jgi:hypothetical protein
MSEENENIIEIEENNKTNNKNDEIEEEIETNNEEDVYEEKDIHEWEKLCSNKEKQKSDMIKDEEKIEDEEELKNEINKQKKKDAIEYIINFIHTTTKQIVFYMFLGTFLLGVTISLYICIIFVIQPSQKKIDELKLSLSNMKNILIKTNNTLIKTEKELDEKWKETSVLQEEVIKCRREGCGFKNDELKKNDIRKDDAKTTISNIKPILMKIYVTHIQKQIDEEYQKISNLNNTVFELKKLI